MDPLKFEDYPLSMRALVGERLPFFTPEQTEKLKDSYNFIGLNYYTTRYAQYSPITEDYKPKLYVDDARVDALTVDKDGIPIEHAEPGSWINVHPRGLSELLLYIKNRYDNPPIYITENALNKTLQMEQVSLAEWALHCQKKGILDRIVDPYLKGNDVDDPSMESMTTTSTSTSMMSIGGRSIISED